jgi:threonine/homoserine/homoserine lactone efflux protein
MEKILPQGSVDGEEVGNTFGAIAPSLPSMETTALLAFATVSVLLVLVPGADWAYAIAAGMRDRTPIPAVGGLLLGYVLITAAVAAGLAAVVAARPSLLTGFTLAGAAYLFYLGIATVRRPAQPADANTPALPRRRAFLRGVGVSGLNPKALLLFLALLPQFVHRGDGWPLAVQIGVLGLLHTGVCALVYSGVAGAARVVLRARPAVARTVSRCSGIAMIVIAAALLAERLPR